MINNARSYASAKEIVDALNGIEQPIEPDPEAEQILRTGKIADVKEYFERKFPKG